MVDALRGLVIGSSLTMREPRARLARPFFEDFIYAPIKPTATNPEVTIAWEVVD